LEENAEIDNLLGTLVLGRLLTPQDFGLVAIAAVAVTTAMGATETGMTTAIVQASVRDEGHYDLAWTINVLRGALVCLVSLLTAPLIARLFDDPRAVLPIRLLALVPLIASLASPRLADLIRELNFSGLAAIGIGTVVVELGVAVSLAGSLGGAGHHSGQNRRRVDAHGIELFRCPAPTALSLTPCGRTAPHRLRPLDVCHRHARCGVGLDSESADFDAAGGCSARTVLIGRQAGGDAESTRQRGRRLGGDAVVHAAAVGRESPDGCVANACDRSHVVLDARYGSAGGARATAGTAGTSPMGILLAMEYLFELLFQAIVPLLTATGAVPRLFLVDALQYVVLIGSMVFFSGPFGLVAAGIARILASIVVVIAGVWVAPPIFAPIAARLTRSGAFLAVLAALSGALAWFTAQVIPQAVGVVLGAAGGAMFLATAWGFDASLKIGIRECLGAFFPILAPAAAKLDSPGP
jgi:hypothetical protein